MIIKAKSPSSSGEIKPIIPYDDLLQFSFKYLDHTSIKFNLSQRKLEYFTSLFDRFKGICSFTMREFTSNRSNSIRAHPITWENTSEPKGFIKFNQTFRETANNSAYQFEVCLNKHGRVHGFIIGSVFFIVWFDPDHKLYPRK
jgi:hypothetical protein